VGRSDDQARYPERPGGVGLMRLGLCGATWREAGVGGTEAWTLAWVLSGGVTKRSFG
jgi:hypothetical protein